MASDRTTKVLLTTIAALLALNLLNNWGIAPDGAQSKAFAQNTNQPAASFNSSEYAKRTADGIAELNQRIGRLESKFDKAMQVKIIESVPLNVLGLPKAEAPSEPQNR